MLNLDCRTIFTSFILVCKSFREVYFDFFNEFHLNLTNESRLQHPKNFLQGVRKLWEIVTYPFETSETSKEPNGNPLLTSSNLETIPKKATKFSFPRCIFNWPDGTPIPKDFCVLVFTSDDSEELNPSKIIAIIILPEIYPKNWKYLTGLNIHFRTKIPSSETNCSL